MAEEKEDSKVIVSLPKNALKWILGGLFTALGAYAGKSMIDSYHKNVVERFQYVDSLKVSTGILLQYIKVNDREEIAKTVDSILNARAEGRRWRWQAGANKPGYDTIAFHPNTLLREMKSFEK